jgi:hypothetical protein
VIITDDFVYLHMPKTGGTFVEAAVGRLYSRPRRLRRRLDRPGRRGVYLDTSRKRDRRKIGGRDQHQTLRELPAVFRDRPVAFTVRNPFDHWVSYFEFGWWRTHPGDTFDERRIRERYGHYPDISFDEYLRACYQPDLLDRGSMPETLASRLSAAGVGWLSWEYARFLSDRPDEVLDDPHAFFAGVHTLRGPADLRFLHLEALNQELYDFLRSVGHTPESVQFILEMGKVFPRGGPRRTSADWRRYYTPDLQKLVQDRESLLFSVFPEYAQALGPRLDHDA